MPKIDFCIQYLEKNNHTKAPNAWNKNNQLRGLMNITMPTQLSDEYFSMQDEVLKEYYSKAKIVDADGLSFIEDRICLYKGDITLIKADAIVNACNEKLLGCFVPLHNCIDNAIHSFAGLQVRRDLMKVMAEQDHDEENGKCKVTKGYNLPSSYIFHTVGPHVFNKVTEIDKKDLKNCYLSCLKMAEKMHLKSIVFCCISTGVYGYPMEQASLIAINTVRNFLKENKSIERVIFNVFNDTNYEIYYRNLKRKN